MPFVALALGGGGVVRDGRRSAKRALAISLEEAQQGREVKVKDVLHETDVQHGLILALPTLCVPRW